MNKLNFWFNKNILRKDLVRFEEGRLKENETFFRFEQDGKVFKYNTVDTVTAFREEMELPNSVAKKITHNKTLTALKTRNLINITTKGVKPGKAAKSEYIQYNDKTFIFAYDENFVLNLYEI